MLKFTAEPTGTQALEGKQMRIMSFRALVLHESLNLNLIKGIFTHASGSPLCSEC